LSSAENIKPAEEWKNILPYVTADIKAAGLDIDPAKLPEYMAKAYTLESAGNKGFILYGGVGSGKTRRVQFLANITGIKMLNAREMCAAWRDMEGNEADFQEYCLADGVRYSTVPRYFHDLIIDDLGTEAITYNSYGTAVDVMTDVIIPMRYSQFPRWRTFFTTNLTKDQLRSRYGERVFSRLNEMSVFIPLTHKDRRMQ
jgi:hypothetical protein